MSRLPRGQDVLAIALQAIASATTIGLSKGWACRLRNQFIAGGAIGDKGKSVRGGRHREYFPPA
ncbi:hypothetical protein [Candidatus Nitrotoga sp. AM1P]|uniref:hypothetical protein n=1 Tax=Candidatus Nitrotoga sp. AM1P TaxID=2559597 RepID=UPI0010B09B4A|nr:hypothetical protein [Candidatus Nitrotoga sp. AM1P]BBJ22625.1 hypothetical protein W01_05520 [Candidatus Nitrotoga sp. AM1P]